VDDDARGFRIALVADELLNPEPGGVDALAVVEREGWGAIQLPPPWYPDEVAGPLLEQVAEHVDEFSRHGYTVVLLGDRPGLSEALAALGVAPPDRLEPESEAEVESFLAARRPARPGG
jgi:hypothetical protein